MGRDRFFPAALRSEENIGFGNRLERRTCLSKGSCGAPTELARCATLCRSGSAAIVKNFERNCSGTVSGLARSGRRTARTKKRLASRGSRWSVGFPAWPISIEHERQHSNAGPYQKRLLFNGERAPHEGDGSYVEGVKTEDRPIPLDEHKMLGAGDTVQIKKNASLREPARQIIFRNAFRELVAGPAAGICNEHAAFVMDRHANATLHGAVVAVPKAERTGECRADVSCCQIRMRGIEREPKR